MTVDFLIIGQGLSGTSLAFHLLEEKQQIIIIDYPNNQSSSKIAAGLFNPITGRKFVKTWLAEELFPYLKSFYTRIEKLTHAKFYYPMDIYRPFNSIEEQNEWSAKGADTNYLKFIKQVHTISRFPYLNDKYGGITLNLSGYLNTVAYLNFTREFFKNKSLLFEELISPNDILKNWNGSHFKFKNIEAKEIILCDGSSTISKAIFPFLPFREVKGEILELEVSEKINSIINRGVWIIPTNNSYVKVGSNYSWNLEEGITGKGKNEILLKFKKIYNAEFKVVDHKSGIRPATKDRRPFLGRHPQHNFISIFNGMGSKGTSLTPYLAKEMVAFLLKKRTLSSEIDVKRFL